MVNPHRQFEELGVFVHGVLAALHAVGLLYNLRRRNWLDVAAHGAALAYDGHAVVKHVRALDRHDTMDASS